MKEAFVDCTLGTKHRFSSANSINIGRLLPQMVYYAASSLEIERRTGAKASYIIPAGNLGNAFAAVWARAVGFPIDRIDARAQRQSHGARLSCERRVAAARRASRRWPPPWTSAIRATWSASARCIRRFASMREQLSADSVDDAAIRRRIGEDFMQYGREWCPHTATAAEVYRRLSERERRERPWVLVATAHPAKFNDIVEPIIGKPVEVPPALERLLQLPQHFLDLPPTLKAVAAALE